MNEEKKNFIDFVRAAKKSKRLTKEFMAIKKEKELKEFFVKEGYKAITLKECEKLLHYRKHMPHDIKKMIDEKGSY